MYRPDRRARRGKRDGTCSTSHRIVMRHANSLARVRNKRRPTVGIIMNRVACLCLRLQNAIVRSRFGIGRIAQRQEIVWQTEMFGVPGDSDEAHRQSDSMLYPEAPAHQSRLIICLNRPMAAGGVVHGGCRTPAQAFIWTAGDNGASGSRIRKHESPANRRVCRHRERNRYRRGSMEIPAEAADAER